MKRVQISSNSGEKDWNGIKILLVVGHECLIRAVCEAHPIWLEQGAIPAELQTCRLPAHLQSHQDYGSNQTTSSFSSRQWLGKEETKICVSFRSQVSSNVPWWLNTGAPLPILKVAWEFPGDTGGRKSDCTGLIETEKEEGKNRTVMQMIKKVQMLPAAVESMTQSIKDNDFAQAVGREVSRNVLWGGWEVRLGNNRKQQES